MDDLALLARTLLAALFLLSGTAKLLDVDGTRSAAGAFGVPDRLRNVVAIGLPLVELTLAVLLLVRATSVAGSIGALLLLGAVSAAVAWSLLHGRHPECHCFGRFGSSDVSWRTLVRNAFLGAAALLGATGSATSLWGAPATSAARAVLIGAAGVAAAGLVLLLEARASRVHQRGQAEQEESAFSNGMQVTAAHRRPAPDFVLPSVDGVPVSLSDLLAPRLPVILLFMSKGCGPCRGLVPVIARWVELYGDRVRFVILTAGPASPVAEAVTEPSEVVNLLDEDKAVRAAYGVTSTPNGVLVSRAGELASPVAVGEGLIRRLLAAALAGNEADLTTPPAQDGAPVHSLDLRSSPGPRSTVTTHPRDDSTVLVDEGSGASVSLDVLGSLVWDSLDGVRTLADVSEELAAEFGADAAVVGSDVLAMVMELGRNGMLAGVAAEWPEYEVVDHDEHDHRDHPHQSDNDDLPQQAGRSDADAAQAVRT